MEITKGKWKTTFNSVKERGVRAIGGFICFLPKPIHYEGQDQRYEDELIEVKANAKLIAEAGTVYNETGYSPRELADQKAELLEAIKYYFSVLKESNGDIWDKNPDHVLSKMINAIKKSTKQQLST